MPTIISGRTLHKVLAISLVIITARAAARAQSHPEYISFRRGVKGALYKPDAGPAPHVGIILMQIGRAHV